MRNLIVQNLPESEENEFEVRQKEDEELVKRLLRVVGVTDEKIESCTKSAKRK